MAEKKKENENEKEAGKSLSIYNEVDADFWLHSVIISS